MTDESTKFEREGMPTALLDMREAAAYLAIAEYTLRKVVYRGEIPHVRVAKNQIRFKVEDLDAYIEARHTREWKSSKKRKAQGK